MAASKDWQKFEELIARLHRALAPEGEVEHDVIVRGTSGRPRQLDVTVRVHVGLCPILVVIECKKYKRSVGIDKVDAFATKLKDVRASYGVMISSSGFGEGARAVAKQHNILLLSYREAEEADWQSLLGKESWLRMVFFRTEEFRCKALLEEEEVDLDPSQTIESGDLLIKMSDVIESVCQGIHSANRVGPFKGTLEFEVPLSISGSCNGRTFDRVIYEGITRAFEYVVNFRLAFGHVLDDQVQGKKLLEEFTSEGFNWREVLREQDGREIFADEWAACCQHPGFKSFNLNLSKLEPFLRVVITRKPKQVTTHDVRTQSS